MTFYLRIVFPKALTTNQRNVLTVRASRDSGPHPKESEAALA